VTTPAGWYPSPEGAGLRYWDGVALTDHYHQPGEQPRTGTSPPGRNDRSWRWTGAATAQAVVLFVTFVLGMLGVFNAEDAWFVALARAAAGLGFVSDGAVAAFEQLPPPRGVSVELFVSGWQGCMGETTPGRVQGVNVYEHYRGEFHETRLARR
jgi:hypothetical protein